MELEKELEEFYREQGSLIYYLKTFNEESEFNQEEEFISQEEDDNSVSSVDQNPVSELEARELFGFSGDFTKRELKDRYKRLLMQWHPDKNLSENAKEMTQKINNANVRLEEVCKCEK